MLRGAELGNLDSLHFSALHLRPALAKARREREREREIRDSRFDFARDTRAYARIYIYIYIYLPLCRLHLYGKGGVRRDAVKAASLFRTAAERGHARVWPRSLSRERERERERGLSLKGRCVSSSCEPDVCRSAQSALGTLLRRSFAASQSIWDIYIYIFPHVE